MSKTLEPKALAELLIPGVLEGVKPLFDPVRILRYRDLEALGYGCRSTIWRQVREGRFPQPRQFENGEVGWPAADILEHVRSLPEGKGRAGPVSPNMKKAGGGAA